MAGFSMQVNDVLNSVSVALLERPLNTTLPGNTIAGAQTIAIVDRAIYVGAQIIVGTAGVNQEIVTVTAITAANFTASLVNAHSAGETVKGATFPGGQTLQGVFANVAAGAAVAPLFTQAEMLEYFRAVENDFLERVRVVYKLGTSVFTAKFAPFPFTAAVPSDCIRVERADIGGAALWPMAQPEIDMSGNGNPGQPVGWYLDRQNTGIVAIDPAPSAPTTLNVLYSQKGTGTPLLTDPLIAPDICWYILKYGILASAWSKEGEMRDARRAAYCAKRYERGVQYTANYMKAMKMSPDFGKGR